jgi:hypothetical protein
MARNGRGALWQKNDRIAVKICTSFNWPGNGCPLLSFWAMADPTLAALFVALAIAVQFVFLIGVYFAYRERSNVAAVFLLTMVASGAWLMLTFVAARGGKLRFDGQPPTMMLLIISIFIVAFTLGFSRFGKQIGALPFAALVGFQAYRLPLELLMHRAYEDGIMPVQMSFSGSNFDIVTGTTAALLGAVLYFRQQLPVIFVRLWNWMGILLLANVLTIAILSMPTPLRQFHNEPSNVWVSQAPWVWLPAVFVLLAIAGHIVIARKLSATK